LVIGEREFLVQLKGNFEARIFLSLFLIV